MNKNEEKESNEKKKQDLKKRLKEYALRIIHLYEALPKHGAVHVITHQLLRSGTSPGTHYREACRAKSDADFISKIEGALQELEESDYWLELLVDGGFVSEQRLRPLIEETNELISIFVKMVINTKARESK
jgi:four helix bundle protein